MKFFLTLLLFVGGFTASALDPPAPDADNTVIEFVQDVDQEITYTLDATVDVEVPTGEAEEVFVIEAIPNANEAITVAANSVLEKRRQVNYVLGKQTDLQILHLTDYSYIGYSKRC